ncbi:hypothetical protein BDR22DRAFT_836144 [Usnea florida]
MKHKWLSSTMCWTGVIVYFFSVFASVISCPFNGPFLPFAVARSFVHTIASPRQLSHNAILSCVSTSCLECSYLENRAAVSEQMPQNGDRSSRTIPGSSIGAICSLEADHVSASENSWH